MQIEGVATADTLAQQGEKEKTTVELAQETKNQFLKLLVTQMQHQDPFSPMDSAQFTQQTMLLAQIEQLQDLNTNVASMADAQQGALISQYTSIVGKKVEALGSQFEIADGDSGTIKFTLPDTPISTEINVFDSYGNLVRSFDPKVQTSGTHQIAFDGKNSQGAALAPGYYNYTVSALNRESQGILPSATYSTGRISSIRLESGTPIFQMGNRDVGLVEIQQIF